MEGSANCDSIGVKGGSGEMNKQELIGAVADATGLSRGDARMPVGITTRFVADERAFTDTALYDVGYKESGGGLFEGSEVELRGLSLIGRTTAAKAQGQLDSLWRKRAK